MENMYHIWAGSFQQDIDEEREWAKIYGPWRQNHVERAVQRKLEQFNLRGFYVQVDVENEEEKLKHNGTLALGKWPWGFPKYDSRKTILRKWEGIHDLIWDMQKIHEDRTWLLYKTIKIIFTYQSQLERDIDELPEKLQAMIFSKVWDDGR